MTSPDRHTTIVSTSAQRVLYARTDRYGRVDEVNVFDDGSEDSERVIALLLTMGFKPVGQAVAHA